MYIPVLFILALFFARVYCSCRKVDFEEKAKVETGAISGILAREVQAEGTIIDLGPGITDHGHCWSEEPGPTINSQKTSLGSATVVGKYQSQATQLRPGTKYYINAWARSGEAVLYGKEAEFTTLDFVITEEIRNITTITAVCDGKIIDDGGNAITARGVCWSTTQYPTLAHSKTIDGSGLGSFTSNLTGLQPNTTYYVRAYAINSTTILYGNQLVFINGAVQDADGNTYSAVTVANMVWMKENLKTTKYNDGTPITHFTSNIQLGFTSGAYFWYENDILNKDIYGALYTWYAVNRGKLCPIGWHVPSDAEWAFLETYLIANGYNYDGTTSGNKIAKALAAKTKWTYSTIPGGVGNADYQAKINATGFTALPGGYRSYNGSYESLGSQGHWWSSTQYSYALAWSRAISFDYYALMDQSNYKDLGRSVRCIRDN